REPRRWQGLPAGTRHHVCARSTRPPHRPCPQGHRLRLRLQPSPERQGSARRFGRLPPGSRSHSGLNLHERRIMNTATLTQAEARTDLYPSRGTMQADIVPRQHPVVWASPDTTPPVERSLIEQYERDGFLVLRDVFSPEEVTNLQAELERLRHQAERLDRPEVITEKGSRQVRSIFKVHELSAVFAKLAADERLAGLASYLLGDQVYLHQSRMNYKPGFHGKEFYWHSDFETWHIEDGMPLPRALSISVSLTDNTPHNGPLLVMPGSHKHYVVCEGETPPDNYQMSLQAQEIGVP